MHCLYVRDQDYLWQAGACVTLYTSCTGGDHREGENGRRAVTNRRLLFGLHSKALHQIQQQFAGHGLNADWQRVVMNVTGEDVDGHGEVGEGEEGSDVVDQVCQNTVRQGSVCMERERERERDTVLEHRYYDSSSGSVYL